MNTLLSSDIKSVSILIKEKDLVPVKSILNFLNDKYSNFSVMNFRTGKIGEDILVSFKVTNEYYPHVIEKFAYNDIPVIMKDKSVQDFIEEKKEQKVRKLRAQGWSDISISKRQISLSELQKLVDEGKVKEVIKEAKGGVGSNIAIVDRAKELLPIAISNAIDNLRDFKDQKWYKIQEAIDQLILIATDKDLKTFHKNEEISNAGLAAVELSIINKNLYDNLLKIANNNRLENLINIKAAISLADLVFSEDEETLKDLPDVVKSLNTRWLRIAFETIQQKLTEDETTLFNNLLQHIEELRQAA